MEQNQNTEDINKWKLKRLLDFLKNCEGHGTSMITIIIPPRKQISDVNRLLTEEYGKCSNIKSRVNKLSVQGAITSAQQLLKQYVRIPENGIAILCGTYMNDENKEKKISKVVQPFKPLSSFLYKCDDKFHIESLQELLSSSETFGFIIVDGSGTLYGTINGNTKKIIKGFDVDLPKKHSKGGQSSVRFSRLRTEARHNYVRKVAEMATNIFITNDKANVTGIILAGFAEFKEVLSESNLFDQRLKQKIIKIVDIQYGGESGFNEAINLAQDSMGDLKLLKEKKIITEFMEAINKDNGKFIFGINETMEALKIGAIDKFIVWDNLELIRVQYSVNEAENIHYLDEKNKKNKEQFEKIQKENGLKIIDMMPLLDWLMENYNKFGIKLELVSGQTSEGNQFVKGFGGIGGLLRYKVDIIINNEIIDDEIIGNFDGPDDFI